MRKLLTFEGHMQMTLYEYKIGKTIPSNTSKCKFGLKI